MRQKKVKRNHRERRIFRSRCPPLPVNKGILIVNMDKNAGKGGRSIRAKCKFESSSCGNFIILLDIFMFIEYNGDIVQIPKPKNATIGGQT